MPNASRIANTLAARANGLDRYFRRMEQLFAAAQIPRYDVERAYAGGMLEFYAFLERSIEDLFVGLLRGRLTHPSPRVRSLVTVNSDIVGHRIIASERRYTDWLPFDRLTVKRAESFFASGLPFSDLTAAEQTAFDALSTVRNALAHQSSAAMRAFRRRFIEGRFIPPGEHRPAAYLRGMHTVGQTRMNFMLTKAVLTMNKLCG